jgi:hypothetical protein
MHIEQVLADVPAAERCRCRDKKDDPQAGNQSPSIMRRIFGS